MHWEWRNCPVALKGQYTRGDHKKSTLMLEAVASYDLWIWHTFFVMTGSNNDINVLNQSPIFDILKNGTFPSAPFEVNGHEYNKGYYLADGIYPDWATLVKGYSCPTEEPTIKFTRFQASARNDVERAFGVLQGRFHIIRLASRSMSVNRMRRVMECCLILHNMILEDNGFALSKWEERFTTEVMENGMERIRNRGRDRDIIAREIRDRDLHNQLTEDLVEHIWNLPPTFRNVIGGSKFNTAISQADALFEPKSTNLPVMSQSGLEKYKSTCDVTVRLISGESDLNLFFLGKKGDN
ncbi:uncharacterized protein [Rutidosis leptorrhynchoides]|uniref:uncharacterized protein n=1 Tax=Rutidosis leptorrhynchoides TaxID=125765 RepID=UPI003A99775A